jgi:hypothetical protein
MPPAKKAHILTQSTLNYVNRANTVQAPPVEQRPKTAQTTGNDISFFKKLTPYSSNPTP